MRLKVRKKLCFLCFALLFCLNNFVVSGVEEVDFQNGDLIQFGSYNDEPILWYVFYNDDQDNLVVISRNILSIKPFDAAGDAKEKDDYYSYSYYYGSNQWTDSSLRKWLNSSDRKIKWYGNAPGEEQIFCGENAFDHESGFLHKTNFSSGELSAIVPTKYTSGGEAVNDRVTLLSSDEYQELYMNSELYPIQIPTISAILKSDYNSSKLKPGNQYPIWTREAVDNPYATHAVKVMTESGDEWAAPASTGRYGVMPMMTLDKQMLKGHLIKGNGMGGNPYIFKINSTYSMPAVLIAFSLLLMLGKVLFLKVSRTSRSRRSGVTMLIISVLLMPSILSFALPEDSEYSKYVIINSYALQKDLVFKRMETMKSNSLFIIDEQGNDVTESIDREIFVNMTLEEKEDFLKYLVDNNYNLLNGGDFRVASFVSEIDGIFNGDHYVVPIEYADIEYQSAMNKKVNDTFKSDNRRYYESHDYDVIMAYLIQNNLTVRHPSDTSGIGIPSLYWEF